MQRKTDLRPALNRVFTLPRLPCAHLLETNDDVPLLRMARLFWLFLLTLYRNTLCSNVTHFGKINATNGNETSSDWNKALNFTEQDTAAALSPVPTSPSQTNVPDTSVVLTSPNASPARSGSAPLPLSGSLPPPVTNVSALCPCDAQPARCDVDCCCDADCSQERALFSRCSVHKVIGETKLCSQDTALYSFSMTPSGLAQVQTAVLREVNPDVLCIRSANYEQGLSFVTPTIPTERNFDELFSHFVGFFFGASDGQSSTLQTSPQENSPGYQYGDIILTEDGAGRRDFFRLPGSGVTANCFDSNPAAFLKDQTSRCVRSFVLVQDCTALEALDFRTYSSFRVFSGKGKEATLVPVELDAVTLQSLEGTRTLADVTSAYQPVLLEPAEVCSQVVLQVKYTVRYGAAGKIVGVLASLVLGAVHTATLPIQQLFQIVFVQEARSDTLLPFRGNPGYVVGLPLVAGWRTAEGVVRSGDPDGTITTLHSSAAQDCLLGSPQRMAVLFGKDVVSGCTFRLDDGANCSLVSEALLRSVKGQSFPDYVASFGNSLPQNPMDWVPIENQTTLTSTLGCSIPLSYHLEVRWTKYGTLVNAQAQIVSVMEKIQTNTSILSSVSSITSSVSFIDVSAGASPGVRVPPTIDAKLPYDFFFPFV
ncbi:tectonic-1 isoform X2 [Electrophorus electricus]|uniref:tectonic-1 isoform X2 n=1 Tax=Electrophorus electricus TaxID=8005 RepID=UPI0015D0158E|nr:tectonic-1 isoform X2 [Electrophorus electricus]